MIRAPLTSSKFPHIYIFFFLHSTLQSLILLGLNCLKCCVFEFVGRKKEKDCFQEENKCMMVRRDLRSNFIQNNW